MGDWIEVDHEDKSAGREEESVWKNKLDRVAQPPLVGRELGLIEKHIGRGDILQFDKLIESIVAARNDSLWMILNFTNNDRTDFRVGVWQAGTSPKISNGGRVIRAKSPLA